MTPQHKAAFARLARAAWIESGGTEETWRSMFAKAVQLQRPRNVRQRRYAVHVNPFLDVHHAASVSSSSHARVAGRKTSKLCRRRDTRSMALRLTGIIPARCELLHICCPPRMTSSVAVVRSNRALAARNGGNLRAHLSPVATRCLCGNIRSTPTRGVRCAHH